MWCTDSNSISNALRCIHVWIVPTEQASVNCFHSSCNSRILQDAIGCITKYTANY